MYVGVMVPLVVVDRIDDALRALRRGAIVQVGQRLAVDHPGKNRELTACRLDIEGQVGIREGNVVHRNFRKICESGNWLMSAFSIAARAELTDMPVSTSARKA